MAEILRSRSGEWSIERLVDRYVVYREAGSEPVEVWSCRTLAELYEWMNSRGLSDFDEV